MRNRTWCRPPWLSTSAGTATAIGTVTATGSATNGCATTRMITVPRGITTTTTATITANRRSQDRVVKTGFLARGAGFFRLLLLSGGSAPGEQLQVIGH